MRLDDSKRSQTLECQNFPANNRDRAHLPKVPLAAAAPDGTPGDGSPDANMRQLGVGVAAQGGSTAPPYPRLAAGMAALAVTPGFDDRGTRKDRSILTR